ncbi:MAG: hypothetical protein LH472_08750 [Pyrinomonadaceae bacterium]|nr:hypothetical protein [Pyrinomonadaceae bacterium]
MNGYYQKLLQNYAQKGLLVDTNILLLWIIGSVDRNFIEKFKRTADRFTAADFDLIHQILGQFQIKVTTTSILTEVSNLMGQLKGKYKEDYFSAFAKVITLVDENLVKSSEICILPEFNKFGLTDSAITKIARDNYLVLTDDLPLYHYLSNLKIDVINFNHIRNL